MIKSNSSPKLSIAAIEYLNPCRAFKILFAEGINLNEAAANLFSMLRTLDKSDARNIMVAPIPNKGIGVAINDRLKRAAS